MLQVNIPKKLKQEVLTIDASAELILFGSRARGEEKEGSDWDFLILTSLTESSKTRDLFLSRVQDLNFQTNEWISAMVHNKGVWQQKYFFTPIFENIKLEGKII